MIFYIYHSFLLYTQLSKFRLMASEMNYTLIFKQFQTKCHLIINGLSSQNTSQMTGFRTLHYLPGGGT